MCRSGAPDIAARNPAPDTIRRAASRPFCDATESLNPTRWVAARLRSINPREPRTQHSTPLANPLASDTPDQKTPLTRAYAGSRKGGGSPAKREFHLRHSTLRGADPVTNGKQRQGAESHLTQRVVSEGGLEQTSPATHLASSCGNQRPPAVSGDRPIRSLPLVTAPGCWMPLAEH